LKGAHDKNAKCWEMDLQRESDRNITMKYSLKKIII
jgi:hypothetical protein